MSDARFADLATTLSRIADAIERLAPPPRAPLDLEAADCFVFDPPHGLAPVRRVNRVSVDLLQGIDRSRDILLENTRRFAAALPANNALL